VKRVVLIVALLVACGPGVSRAVPSPVQPNALTAASWASAQIRTVASAGLLGADPLAFRPDDTITRGELYDALSALGKPVRPPADPARALTIRELDAQLVAALDLLPFSRRIRLAARDAGLEPTPFLGTETVARLLRLRVNHPQGSEDLERRPRDPASRAEAAYSLARLLELQDWELQRVRDAAGAFALPALTDWQRQVLARALRFVGFPYVFSGVSERPQQLWSAAGTLVPAPAGFDCSGFVWRVYKLEPFAGAPGLGELIKGRTTYAMSAEVGRASRIAAADVQAGDLIFFGPRGPRSKPAQISHMGIALGNGWFVHSSDEGVALETLTGWYADRFAWARRPLAEAGLSA
jgi:hypothetical protein